MQFVDETNICIYLNRLEITDTHVKVYNDQEEPSDNIAIVIQLLQHVIQFTDLTKLRSSEVPTASG